MASPTYAATKRGYENLWKRCELDAHRVTEIDGVLKRISENLERYWTVETATGVPWFVIAAAHYRESNLNFDGVLHNGEHIIGTNRKTKLVPAGRGPFATWEDAAVDAIRYKNLDRVDDWPASRCLYELERYNGWGYMGKINSPYLWAGTNLSTERGKYVRDHVFDANAPEKQLGCAALLKRMTQVDPDVKLRLDGVSPDDITPAPVPEVDEPANDVLVLSAVPTHVLIDELRSRSADISGLWVQYGVTSDRK